MDNPVASSPGTPNAAHPVTSNPVTSNPVTSNPVTSNPVTSSPDTSSPDTRTPLPARAWTGSQLVAFRFFFAYFVLYIFFNPNEVFPGSAFLYNFYIQPFHHLIPWIGKHLLHLAKPVTTFTNGSGDTTYDNLIYLFLAALAVLACLIWSLLDRRRPSYRNLYYWLTTLVRFYLGITMLAYGYAKLFKMQFPSAGLFRLLEPYGDSTPMGLAWTFMGYSYGYNLFTGFAEVIAGVLLLFRRTTAIGAFLAIIVTANIVAMNYSFDIPVKLLSSTMIIMALFLLGTNIRRLWGLFFQNRTVRLGIVTRPPMRKAPRIILAVIKYLLILYVIVGYAISYAQARSLYGDRAPHAPLYGIYNTRTFLLGRDTLEPLQTDTIRWRQLVIDGSPGYSFVGIKMMNDSMHRYEIKTDSVHRFITISDFADSMNSWQLDYLQPTADTLILWGRHVRDQHTDSIRVTLIRYPLDKFRLRSRGFNWINEYPYNR